MSAHTAIEKGILAGIRVLQWGEHRAVGLTGMLLAEQGAEVIEIVMQDTLSTALVNTEVLRKHKRCLCVDPNGDESFDKIKSIIERVDVFIEDFGDTILSQRGINCRNIQKNIHPGLITCSLPGFPQADQRSGKAWSEEQVSIEAGLYENLIGIGKPDYFPLPIASTITAFQAVNAIVMALIGRRKNNCGQHIEIPVVNVAKTQQVLRFMVQSHPPTRWSTYQMAASPFMGIYKTENQEYIYLHLAIPRHLRRFLYILDTIGFPTEKALLREVLSWETKKEPTLVKTLKESLKITRILKNLFLKKHATTWEDVLSSDGLCCVKVRTVQEWISSSQAVKSGDIITFQNEKNETLNAPGPILNFKKGYWLPVSYQNRAVDFEDLFKKWNKPDFAAPTKGEKYNPMDGVKILDLSRIIAGPFSGKTFAEYGATVLHVSFRHKHLAWEEPFHVAFGGGKESITVDITSEEGREAFFTIITDFKPDLLIHNFSQKTLNALQIDVDSLERYNPKMICINISAYNKKGPWKNRVGLEWNIQAACGLLTPYTVTKTPAISPVPMVDMSTGLIATFGGALAYYHSLFSFSGNSVSVALNMPANYFILDFLNDVPQLHKNIHNFYRAKDHWFFLSINHRHRKELVKIPELRFLVTIDIPKFSKKSMRFLRKRTVQEWIDLVQFTGLASCVRILKRKPIKYILKEELVKPKSLFTVKNHKGIGKVLVARSPVEIEPTPLVNVHSSHSFGSDTHSVYKKFGLPVKTLVPKQSAIIKKTNSETIFQRISWLVSQAKWILAILYKNYG